MNVQLIFPKRLNRFNETIFYEGKVHQDNNEVTYPTDNYFICYSIHAVDEAYGSMVRAPWPRSEVPGFSSR